MALSYLKPASKREPTTPTRAPLEPQGAPKQPIREGKLASLAYNLLLKYHNLERNRYFRPVWRHAWTLASQNFSCPVSTNIHGRRAIVNFGHTYPLYARRVQQWNNPLIELVYQTYASTNAPITVIDVGAGVGDTVLLLEANCPRMVGEYICVEGSEEFFAYLRENLAGLGKATIFRAMLSDTPGPIPTLVRTHAGTASAQGDEMVQSTTLDSLIARSDLLGNYVLKIDVDGFDGKVLGGARSLLATSRPAVIFEWHPILCRDSGNSWLDHFKALHERGYRRYTWFTKYGQFSHFMRDIDEASIAQLAEVCAHGRHDDDWHYDVVALTDDHKISDVALAELSFANKRRSWY